METINKNSITFDNTESIVSENSIGENYSGKNISVSTTVSQHYRGSDYNEGWYEGEWSNGKPNGYGRLTYDDFEDDLYYSITIDNVKYKALYYEGYFRDGWRYGTGKVVYENDWKEEGTYYGTWAAGQKIFEGKLWHKDSVYLDGYQIATSSTDSKWQRSTDAQ